MESRRERAQPKGQKIREMNENSGTVEEKWRGKGEKDFNNLLHEGVQHFLDTKYKIIFLL